VPERLQDAIERVESGYEFLLAYAAQGRESDEGPDSEVRTVLNDMRQAATGLVDLVAEHDDEFAWVVSDDARKSVAAIALVLRQASIGSEIVDNLNASIHLRALLTDLFLVSETAAQGATA
jgi:hypothetical protein